MKYWKGKWNCVVAETEHFETGILSTRGWAIPFLQLTNHGHMLVYRGFCSDGPSFPAIKTKTFMRGAVGHDALYALLRDGFQAHRHDEVREMADLLLHEWIIEDGMWERRADWIYKGVRLGGGPAAKQKERKIYEVP